MASVHDAQVMMLAAGLGTRLWPLTADRGKPAVPFLGRPLIRGMVDWLERHGVRRIVVNTHHQPGSIQAALADVPAHVSVAFSHEPEILGTAGGLAQGVQAGLLDPNKTTIVVNAKLVTTLDVSSALSAHRRANARVTLILRTNRAREAFTTVRVADGWVRGFGPSRVPEGERPLLFTGLHILEPAVLARAELRFSDTIRDLYPKEIKEGRVLAVTDDTGVWAEASTLERYLRLQLERVSAEPAQPRPNVHDSARVERSVLDESVQVAEDAVVRSSVLWPNAQVDRGAHLDRVVLAEGAFVPKGARLSNVVAVREELCLHPPENAPSTIRAHGLALVPLDL